ncbi:MAG TPA: LysM peptidoglycan-binding domain-containing protein, partial [Micromonosporaceae bacterium]|nr:LysM peptidoglycan-binding domain-containing protein [Micromonosporaceae bacterium]
HRTSVLSNLRSILEGTMGGTATVAAFGHGRLRLTRRGRAVLVGFFVLVASVVIAFLAPASRAADPSGAAQIAVVQPGDSLWSIAERHAAGYDRITAVEEIRRLNRLDGYTVHAGQRLAVPRSR